MLPLMAMGVSVAVLPAVADEKTEFEVKSSKKQKKTKQTKKDSQPAREKQFRSDKEALWHRFGEVAVASVHMEDMPIEDLVAYLQAEAAKGGVDVVVKSEADLAGGKFVVPNLKLEDVTLAELIDCAASQIGVVCGVEGNVLTFYSSKYRLTRTYEVSEGMLRAYLGISEDDSLVDALLDEGISYPSDSELVANGKNKITLKSGLGTHEDMEELVHEVETLKADVAKANGIYRRAYSALSKAAKSMSKIDSSNSTKAGKAMVKVVEILKKGRLNEQERKILRIYLAGTSSAARKYRKVFESVRFEFERLEGDLYDANNSDVRNSLNRLDDYMRELDF